MSSVPLTQIKSLRTLIKVRERQGKRLEATLLEARKLLAEREADVEAALAEQAEAVENEAASRRERDDMFGAAFTTHALRALDFRIDELKAETVKCEKNIVDRRKAVSYQVTEVEEAQSAVRRNEQRIESFQDRLKKILAEKEAAIEEEAEEEAAEAAAGRFIARNRAAKEVSCE